MKAFVLVVLSVAVVVIPIFCQQTPAFEVTSVKIHPPPVTLIGIQNRGGRFSATGFSLKMLVGRGYGVPEQRVLNAPAWGESERYDIEAKAPEGAPQGQIQPMLQGLLQDRFQLKAHRETRELPVYELVVSKPGKMKLSDDQTPPAPAIPPGGDRRPGPRGDGGPGARGAGPGAPRPRPRGTFGRGSFNGRMNVEGSAVPMLVFVTSLQGLVDRPIIDKTNLMGLFDMKLEWVPGAEAPPGPFGPNPNAPPPPPSDDAVSIFTAIQEQLGLKLESAKGPVEVIVVDSAQRPSEN